MTANGSGEPRKHTISVLVENRFGVLSRVAGLFSARGYNIESLSVGETLDPTVSRMTLVVRGDEFVIEQVTKQLHKLIDVAGRGFVPLAPPNQFEPISQLLWADAVFVRDFAALPAYADAQLLKGALILNDVYHSFDLALCLLAEHDRRRGTGYGPIFHQALQSAPALHPQFLTVKAQP